MLEGLFRLLFKYRPLVFEQGDFTVAVSRPMLVALAVTAAVAAYALATYRGAPATRARDRAALAALRLALLGVLAFCLFRPTLVVKAAVPQQNFLGVLVDDSRSMPIADATASRAATSCEQQLAARTPRSLSALSKKFVLRFFRFSSSADRIDVARRTCSTAARRRASARRSSARATSSRGCRSPASSWSATARTRPTARSTSRWPA